ncbi:uncharacterized protein LOC142349853 isoform X1 [Convolutriloba macropyga]|uniref:uncharacterized protein LOC142349853 isoform X1 n=1 Tax=Convolutriloba macropyga TaxID=536237 RepID=UPI003F528A7D
MATGTKRKYGSLKLNSPATERPRVQAPPGVARELSRLERGFKYITDLSVGIIGCKFILKSKSELDDSFFKLFVENYWNFAPLLRMNIIEHGSKKNERHFYFKEMPEIPFDEIIQKRKLQPGQNLIQEVEKEICIPFNVDREPLWRVIVYELPDDEQDVNNNGGYQFRTGVVLVVNHTVCDGVSMIELYKQIPKILHRYFLQSTADTPSGSTSSDVTKNEEIPVALEDVVPNIHFPVWFEFLGSLGSKILAKTKVVPPFHHEFLEIFEPPIWKNKSIQPAPKILTFKLSSEMTAKLIKITKHQKCTFTGTLVAAMSIASVKQMQNGKITKSSTFRAIIPVDLRKYFLDHRYDQCVANYTSISPLVVKISVRPVRKRECEYDYFWSLARQITRDIHKLVRNSETIKAINVVAPFMDHPSFASEMFKKTTTHSSAGRIGLFSISNLGIIDGPKDLGSSAEYEIDQVSFGANEVFGGSIFANNVATYDGCLTWNLVYAVHVVSDESANAVLQGLKETLNFYNRLPSVDFSSTDS